MDNLKCTFNRRTIDGCRKVYIAGMISNDPDYKEKFSLAEEALMNTHHKIVMNPTILPAGFEQSEYMAICYKMIDACDAVVFLPDWAHSDGARMEMGYAIKRDIPRIEYKYLR